MLTREAGPRPATISRGPVLFPSVAFLALCRPVPQCLLHPVSGHLVVAVEALCVDLEQHFHRVARSLGYLRRRYSPL